MSLSLGQLQMQAARSVGHHSAAPLIECTLRTEVQAAEQSKA
jgi:hypothetical protein